MGAGKERAGGGEKWGDGEIEYLFEAFDNHRIGSGASSARPTCCGGELGELLGYEVGCMKCGSGGQAQPVAPKSLLKILVAM